MNMKLHAICDSTGRPVNLFVTAGQVSDYIGAPALIGPLCQRSCPPLYFSSISQVGGIGR